MKAQHDPSIALRSQERHAPKLGWKAAIGDGDPHPTERMQLPAVLHASS